MNIPFGDLKREYLAIKDDIDKAVNDVLNSGWFVLGEQVDKFEQEFAEYIGSKYCVSCASGTDAIALSLMALGIGSGDEVVTTNITAVPTISAISMAGATPVLADTKEENCLIDSNEIKKKISSKTKAILPVHLYGQPCDMVALKKISKDNNIDIIEDACQAHGAKYKNKKAGNIGTLGCFSFYPSKNLGCYGDGGAITTNSPKLYKKLMQLRNYGQTKRYYHDIIGINSRLDEIQAAILREKLKYMEEWNDRRRQIAKRYNEEINNRQITKMIPEPDTQPNYHLYVVKINNRKKFIDYMANAGIQVLIHYPINIHRQKSYKNLKHNADDFPISQSVSNKIVSLPIYPYLKDEEVAYIIKTVNSFA